MCLYRLLFLRMLNFCRPLPDEAVNQNTSSQKYKWYAEPLTHIQDHSLFKTHLRFLDEFDEETHSEHCHEEYSYEFSSVHLPESVFIKKYQDYTKDGVAESLI